jgi:GT2 family glycosyltransferase
MPENKPERIAAVVVTYNRKSLLVEGLDSLLRQSRPLDALYIIDNASADGTYETLLDKDWITPVGRSVETTSHIPEIGPTQATQTGGIVKAEGLGDGGRTNHRQAPLDAATRPAGNSRIWDALNVDEPVETVRSVMLPASSGGQLEVHYVRMSQNTGGAGGFAEGMQRAAATGFDWLWLMDDDLLAAPDALEMLVRKKNALETSGGDPFILNSLAVARDQPDNEQLAFPLQELSASGDPKAGTYYWHLSQVRGRIEDGLYEWACPFNGTFVPARAVERVGLPNREFFINGDEKDYLWRLAKTFRLYTVIGSRVFHPQAQRLPFDWKQYYNIRNMLVVNRHFRFSGLRNLRLIVLSLARGLRHGRWGLALVLRALGDGLTGRLGKREDLHP